MNSNVKSVLIILVLLISICGIALYLISSQQRPTSSVAQNHVQIDGTYLPTARDINEFTLTDNTGNSFSQENLKGKWTLMFFGFTNCGMVCPTTMTELNKMYKDLEQELPNNLPQVVLVSVDPARDTVERLNEYVKTFNPHFIGLRGSEEDTVKLEKQLHIAAVKMQANSKAKNNYIVNHSAEILVFNPEGKLQAYLSYPHKSEQLILDFKTIANTRAQ